MKQLVTVNCTRSFAVALGVHYELQTYFMLRELKKQTSVHVRWCQRMSNIITDVTANLITLNDVCAHAFHLTTYVHTLSTTVLQCGTNLYQFGLSQSATHVCMWWLHCSVKVPMGRNTPAKHKATYIPLQLRTYVRIMQARILGSVYQSAAVHKNSVCILGQVPRQYWHAELQPMTKQSTPNCNSWELLADLSSRVQVVATCGWGAGQFTIPQCRLPNND